MDIRKVMAIKEQMERLKPWKLQPHFIASFFLKAFKEFGGTIYEREPGRYEITYVPASIRNRDRVIGNRGPILSRYEESALKKIYALFLGNPSQNLSLQGILFSFLNRSGS